MVAMLFCSISLMSQSKKHMSLYFENRVRQKVKGAGTSGSAQYRLAIDSSYINSVGQSFTVTNFKYYISNIKLTDSGGRVFENKNSYYLIDENDSASHHIQLDDIPEGDYSKISFTIGVDSLHNCSGAQSGALDPIHGMFWTWNTGYIFLKLEGKAPASKQPGHIFEYHIGGYKAPSNCIREVSFDIAGIHSYVSDDDLLVGASPGTCQIRLSADISSILSAHYTVDFSKLSSVTDFHNAATIADNYKDMFHLVGVFYGSK